MTTRFRQTLCVLCACTAVAVATTRAQIDPEARKLLHLGYSQAVEGSGPSAAYAFYYWNMPDFPSQDQVLRLVIAPGYVDSELGFKSLLGENTDLGVGVFGGLFANSYEEVRGGDWIKAESFDGDGGGANVSVYHLFNPASRIPLNGMLRGGMNYHVFRKTDDTASSFEMPDDQPFFNLRTGFRWGGKEPVLGPRLAMEISAWYEMEYRPDNGHYGYSDDRNLKSMSHRFLGRAQLNFTMPKTEHYIMFGLMGGRVVDGDRLSAFRLGGALPFTSEFPLYMPGYFYQELSAQSFGLMYGTYSIPLGEAKQWNIMFMAAGAVVDYSDGMQQPGDWHSGFGGGVGYTAKSRRWRVLTGYGYGVDAIRKDGRGGQNVGVLFQYNFGKTEFASDAAFEQLQNARTPTR